MDDFYIIIPARFHSQRFLGKMLAAVGGKPLIQHTYERALLCGAKSVVIATDDPVIEQVASAFGATVCMTSAEHTCGTDRISEAVQKLEIPDDGIVVNIQGDEPLMPPEAVRVSVLAMLEHKDAAVTTLCSPILEEAELLDPNLPKVVMDRKGFALYFSRSPIPCDRERFDVLKNRYYRHIGLYAYRARTLKQYSQWGPAPLEDIEKLEQLRVLWNGEKIQVSIVEKPLPPGVDTETDLLKFAQTVDLTIG